MGPTSQVSKATSKVRAGGRAPHMHMQCMDACIGLCGMSDVWDASSTFCLFNYECARVASFDMNCTRIFPFLGDI